MPIACIVGPSIETQLTEQITEQMLAADTASFRESRGPWRVGISKLKDLMINVMCQIKCRSVRLQRHKVVVIDHSATCEIR